MQRYCERCNSTMEEKNFYKSNNLEKYPDGFLPICKKCTGARINNFDPDTYLWILQEIDVPYVPNEWNKILLKYRDDKEKLTGLTILGRYLSLMKIKQWKNYRWKDSEFIQELENRKIEDTMTRQGYDYQQIQEVLDKASVLDSIAKVREEGCDSQNSNGAVPYAPYESLADQVTQLQQSMNEPQEDYFAQISGAEEDDIDLTDEDRVYLRLKWGRTYKPDEWVQMEKMYNEMMDSYDIQTAGHIDTLKLVCKTSLKANQLLDIGDRSNSPRKNF